MRFWCSIILTGPTCREFSGWSRRVASSSWKPISEAQREAGWGPTSSAHLLRLGELRRLVSPLKVVHGREVLETVDAEHWRAVASVLAVKK
jgi:hypothetical protein